MSSKNEKQTEKTFSAFASILGGVMFSFIGIQALSLTLKAYDKAPSHITLGFSVGFFLLIGLGGALIYKGLHLLKPRRLNPNPTKPEIYTFVSSGQSEEE